MKLVKRGSTVLFYFIQCLYQGQTAMRLTLLFIFTLRFHGFAKFSACVRPAANVRQFAIDNSRIITIIPIGLQVTLKAFK